MAVRNWQAKLAQVVEKRARADAAAEAAQYDLYAAMLAAFESGQVSYRQMAAITGLSRERVAQVLRKTREARSRELVAS